MKHPLTCDQAQELLYKTTEQPSPELGRGLRRHLENCHECRKLSLELAELHHRASSLPRQLTPPRDLWPELQQRLESRSTSAGVAVRRLQLAAGVFLVAGAAALAILIQQAQPDNVRQTMGVEVAQEGKRSRTQLSTEEAADLAHVEDRVLSTRKDILIAFARQDGQVGGDFDAVLEANIEELNAAIGEIRLALSDRPENSRLSLLLAAKFQQEAALLKQLNRI